MSETIKRRAARILAASALAFAAVGAVADGTQAATAAPQLGTGCYPATYSLYGNSASVVGTFTETCYPRPDQPVIIDFPLNLFELVNGSWVVAASGDGVAAHQCVGTAAHEYRAGSLTGTYACG
jgi:hypothetical protein